MEGGTGNLNINTITCGNCGKEITKERFFLHEDFCFKNYVKCLICGEMCLLVDMEVHFEGHEKNDAENVKLNEKIMDDVYCVYCGLLITLNLDHQDQCAARTTICDICGEIVINKNLQSHLRFNCNPELNYSQLINIKELKKKIVSQKHFKFDNSYNSILRAQYMEIISNRKSQKQAKGKNQIN